MSIPEPNSSVSATVTPSTPSLATASVTVTPSLPTVGSEPPASPANNIRTPPPPPSQQPPTPPYRAIAPLHHSNQYQQPYPQTIPNRRQNSPHQIHHQDPSPVLYPLGHSGRGYSTRPVRMSSQYVTDNNNNQIGYPPRPVFSYSHQQFGPNQMESVMHFMSARNPQIHQYSSHHGSSSPSGMSPMRGIPHFLQPRVAPPSTSILDTSQTKNARGRDAALVLVKGRKVRITEGASLYSLCRSWLRNGAHEGVQSQRSDMMKPLPKPLPVDMLEPSLPNDPVEEEPNDEDKEDEESVKQLSEKDLLKRHVERAKKVRARLREERLRKIARYKARLALLLPQSGSGEQYMKNE